MGGKNYGFAALPFSVLDKIHIVQAVYILLIFYFKKRSIQRESTVSRYILLRQMTKLVLNIEI